MLRRITKGIFLLFILANHAFAQTDNSIKVTTILHEDGTKTVKQVNPEKRSMEAATYTNNDKLIQRIVYNLNEQNQAEGSTVYGAKGEVIMKATYKLDDTGRPAEEVDYASSGALQRRLVFHYDASGRVTKIDAYDAQGNEINQSPGKPDKAKKPPRRH